MKNQSVNIAVFPQIALTLLLAACTLPGTSYTADSNAPLIRKPDLLYVGAFRVPAGGSGGNTFSYGGSAITYNPAGPSLIMVGHKHHQKTAEISIPRIKTGATPSDLDRARLLQPFVDTTAGLRRNVNPGDPNDQIVGGNLLIEGKLFVNVYSSYDGEGTQDSSMFVTDWPIGSTQRPAGPYRIGADSHTTAAYMTLVPDEWQAALGGSALVGNCCRSIIGFQSHGPAISVFEPRLLGEKPQLKASQILFYPARFALGGKPSSAGPLFNLTTRVEGVVFPAGTRSVLFFGKHGIGEYCYGEAKECSDPAMVYKGTHAYPYVYQVWAYDANELLDVRNGRRQSYDVEPYSTWTFNLPFETDNTHSIGGVAYDAANGRLFLSQLAADKNATPLVHVFRIEL
jgi:hypothetical protein